MKIKEQTRKLAEGCT